MSARSASDWVVVKFGGTSVSTLANWRNIALIVHRRVQSGGRVLVVHSALTRITDMLEKLLAAASAGQPDEALKAIEDRHRQLTTELAVGVSPQLQGYFDDLRQMANGIAMVRELSDRTRARVMANGELMATEIGARFLKSQGIDVTWMDAREMLTAEDRGASAKASVLSATCAFAPDAGLEGRLDASTPVVITQGFIARDSEGNTCLLGRGGSDTSASYLAAKIRAKAIEIWTDVPGMFSANPRATPSARLIRALHYDEAQEIATSGAKVLHPRCLLPARQYQIPLYVYSTQTPDLEGTLITGESVQGAVQSQGHHADLARESRHVAPGRLHGRRLHGVQGARHVGRPRIDVGDQRDGVARPGRQHARRRVVRQAAARPVEAVRRAGHRTLRLGVAGRPQHPRHPAQARRRVRAVRRAKGVPGEPGRQRSQLHLRGRRKPG
jgi:diaminopimelate decarboxylase/aspartate kinase